MSHTLTGIPLQELGAQQNIEAPVAPQDIEASQPWTDTEVLSGFPQTAHFLAADPDKSAVIFRRFDKASIRNLLYLEGRIAALEALQDDLDREDKSQHIRNNDVAAAAASWEDFAILGWRDEDGGIPETAFKSWNQRRFKRLQKLSNAPDLSKSPLVEERWKLAVAIKEAMKEYQEALLLYSRVLSLQSPAERSRKTVADWFKGVYTNPSTKEKTKIRPTPQFYESSAMFDIFERDRKDEQSERRPNDLISLHAPADDDFISKQLANSPLTFKVLKKKDMSDSKIIYTPEKRIHRSVTVIQLVAAIIFLVVAVWVLSEISEKRYKAKLSALTAFVVVFGIWTSFMTSAQKSEIFAATAAYAAVLVVYVARG